MSRFLEGPARTIDDVDARKTSYFGHVPKVQHFSTKPKYCSGNNHDSIEISVVPANYSIAKNMGNF
jgi:hypothetical protein